MFFIFYLWKDAICMGSLLQYLHLLKFGLLLLLVSTDFKRSTTPWMPKKGYLNLRYIQFSYSYWNIRRNVIIGWDCGVICWKFIFITGQFHNCVSVGCFNTIRNVSPYGMESFCLGSKFERILNTCNIILDKSQCPHNYSRQ